MRRKDKEITSFDEIEALLQKGRICRLGFTDGDTPYVVPMSYGYSKGALYFHSAPEGRKIALLKTHKLVCFEVSLEGELKTGTLGCEWGIYYESVIGLGKPVFLLNSHEKREALDYLMKQYSGSAGWEFSEKALEGVCVFKLEIDSVTGKRSLH